MDYWELINEGLVMLVTGLIGLVLWYVRQWLTGKITKEQLGSISLVVDLAVKASEQYGGSAEDKKRQAIAIASEWLTANNIKINLDQLDAAIESAVMEQFNFFRQTIAPSENGGVIEDLIGND